MKRTRVLVRYVQGAKLRDYEQAYVPMVRDELRKSGEEFGLAWEDDPAKADLIVLWEGFEYKTPAYIATLENDPLLKAHAERVFGINYDDHPEGFLSGLYTSLEQPFFDADIHRSWPFVLMNNPVVYELARSEVLNFDPELLFCFTGATSHQVRKRLFSLFSQPSPIYHVEHIKKWYNHGDADRRRFVQIALNSAFCLCPHGYCAYTPRITEVMAMARAPVIIADDWIPFSFDAAPPYYVRVLEKDIEHLPEILHARRTEARDLGHNARDVWEQHCGPQRRVVAAIQCLSRLAAQRKERMTLENYRARWHAKELRTNLGWRWHQRTALRVEQRLRRWWPAAKVPGVSPLMRYRNAASLHET